MWQSLNQACKVLLDAGAPLDTKASSGGTALMFAAAAGYTDVVTLLLEKGADVNATVKVCGIAQQSLPGGAYELHPVCSVLNDRRHHCCNWK